MWVLGKNKRGNKGTIYALGARLHNEARSNYRVVMAPHNVKTGSRLRTKERRGQVYSIKIEESGRGEGGLGIWEVEA